MLRVRRINDVEFVSELYILTMQACRMEKASLDRFCACVRR